MVTLFCDFTNKKVVSAYSKPEMRTFIVDPKTMMPSGSLIRRLPNEYSLVKEVEQFLVGNTIVLWDSSEFKSWKLKPWKMKELKGDIIDLKEQYLPIFKPKTSSLADIAIELGIAKRQDIVKLDQALKKYESGKWNDLMQYSNQNAYWCAQIEERCNFLKSER